MIESVLGFLTDGERVLLLAKSRGCHAGRFNGVGGPLAQGESPEEAMSRLFKSETGVTLDAVLRPRLTLQHPNETVHVFLASGNVAGASSHASGSVLKLPIIGTDWRREPVVPDLRWIIPFVLDEGAAPAVVVKQ